MIRKSLFWGLTLVLVAALVSLIIRGRQMERQQSAKPTEVVRQSRPSPTRVLNPEDLEIANPTRHLDSRHTALTEIEIRNHGTVPYSGIQLQIVFLDHGGKELATKTHFVAGTVVPGTSLRVTDLVIQGIPASATGLHISILSADLGE